MISFFFIVLHLTLYYVGREAWLPGKKAAFPGLFLIF
jgi:hypothetical protein